jgi:putative radical SAM enzyme (TIGR03279 family)
MYTELFETIYPINTPNKDKGLLVTAVDPFSLADELGIEPGDLIVRVNGNELRDFIDFQFYTGSEDRVKLELVKKSAEPWEIDVEIGEGEIWGLDFQYFSPRQCANDCIFCFCNQNPKGSRESLFFKDEDIRLSFLHGNYTTMSSISKMELERIVEQRLSPQYVSVHATDPEVRRYLLGRKRPDDVMAKMRYLTQRGIELHAQIVLCPTINDGEVLRRTVEELAELHPGLTSVAVVPVVVTSLHNYRHLLSPVTDDYARSLIREVTPRQRGFRSRVGSTFLFLADEFYLRAGLPVPGRVHYGDYPQIEDGVGMVRRFFIDARRALSRNPIAKFGVEPGSLHGTIATGELFAPILSDFVGRINKGYGTRLKVIAVKNRFFGEEVTVAGLITGRDLLAVKNQVEGRFMVVPEQACLKQGRIFLDDLTIDDLERELSLTVAHGGGSIDSMLERVCQLRFKAQAGLPSQTTERRSSTAPAPG